MRDKQTKIIATISDKHSSISFIKKLYKNGMDAVRLNTAHQDKADTKKVIDDVRKVSDSIAIIFDIKGPEIRTSSIETPITLKTNQLITIKIGTTISNKDTIYVSYNFIKEVKKGDRIVIDDGQVSLRIISKSISSLRCKVEDSGLLGSKKTVNIPNVNLSLPSLTKRDREFISLAKKEKIDFIAMSFVRSKKDVLAVKKLLGNSGIEVISKIENKQGIQNIDEIIEVSYGIMVARGDLGVELPPEAVPLLQKRIINKCIMRAKPVITATQMLQSMIEHPRPTRAEVSDVANAILDGSDVLMLSGETAIGKYPMQAVRLMSRIAKSVESRKPLFKYAAMKQKSEDLRTRLGKAALSITADMAIKALVIPSHTGRTAKYVASFRGRTRIFAPCFNSMKMRQLNLSYGINTTLIPEYKTTDKLVVGAISSIIKLKKLSSTDLILVVHATPKKFSNATNFLEINTVKNILKLKK